MIQEAKQERDSEPCSCFVFGRVFHRNDRNGGKQAPPIIEQHLCLCAYKGNRAISVGRKYEDPATAQPGNRRIIAFMRKSLPKEKKGTQEDCLA